MFVHAVGDVVKGWVRKLGSVPHKRESVLDGASRLHRDSQLRVGQYIAAFATRPRWPREKRALVRVTTASVKEGCGTHAGINVDLRSGHA